MISVNGEFVQLTVPLSEAVAFAMGRSDWSYDEPTEVMRRIVGELAVDRLQFTEQWRAAAMLRQFIETNWPCGDA